MEKKSMRERRLLWKLPLVVFIVTAFAIGVLAQEPPPPPKPLIWQPPAAEAISTYKNARFGFSIDFPGIPSVSEGRPDGPPTTLNIYSVRRQGSLTSMRVINLTADDLTKIASKEFDVISQVKAAYTQGSYKIEKIYRETANEIDFAAFDGLYYRRINARLIDGKLFELYIDVTNWHILARNHSELAEKFTQEVDRFFKSFKLEK